MEMCKERRRDNLISHSLHFHLAVFVVPAIGGEVTRFTKGYLTSCHSDKLVGASWFS